MNKSAWEEFYHEKFVVLADPRTDDWFMVHSPFVPLVATIVYLTVVLNAKKIMKNLPALELKGLLMIYNIFSVYVSAYIVYEMFWSVYPGYALFCEPVDYSTSPGAMRMAHATWVYFICKYIELLDTVFFILRKKFNQVSLLHVYHHSTMLWNGWVAAKYFPGGHLFIIPLLNSLVHVFMYLYYGLSALGPRVRPFLWWKKYLTTFQLIQFIAIGIHNIYPFIMGCKTVNLTFSGVIVMYQITLFSLFYSFYRKSYSKNAEKIE